MQRHKSAVTLRDMFLLLCTSSVIAHAQGSTNIADEVLHTEADHCQPILVNGESMPTVPEYMPSFPISLKGIKRHFVCKLSASFSGTKLHNFPVAFFGRMSVSKLHIDTSESESTAKILVTDEDTEYKIFVADLQDELEFTSIPSTKVPRYITYDSVEKKLYWTDNEEQRVYRADEDGGNREEVTSGNVNGLLGIAIAESSRILYIAYSGSKEITTVDIGQGSALPGNETSFWTRVQDGPVSLEVDEEQGFLYWSINNYIVRRYLNGSGGIEHIYYNSGLSGITGLSIDLSRDPRRIHFCDFGTATSFYMDIDSDDAHELTGYMIDPDDNGDDSEEREKLRDISYFNGTLYWTKEGIHKGIAVMTNYDKSSPSFDIKETSENKPYQLLIINVNS